MSGLLEKAGFVVGEALRSPTFDDSVAPNYEKQIYPEIFTFVFGIGKRFRIKFWLGVVAYYGDLLVMNGVDLTAPLKLMAKKNELYGNKQLYKMGSFGILIRSMDKHERIQNIDNGVCNDLLQEESRLDSVLDLFNYAILAVLVLRKEL